MIEIVKRFFYAAIFFGRPVVFVRGAFFERGDEGWSPPHTNIPNFNYPYNNLS